MIEQMQNYVLVEGLLSEIALEKKTYQKDMKDVECIRGNIKVRVVMSENNVLEIPVQIFTNKLKKDGQVSSIYKSFENFMATAKSIAAVGEADADAVRISGGAVKMNERYTDDGRFISYPQLSTNFISVISRSEMHYQARADLTAIIYDMFRVCDKDGTPTDVLQINCINVGYNGYTDIIPVKVTNPSYVSAIEATYTKGDVVAISSKLDFSSVTEVVYEAVEIGDPIEKRKTINKSDLVLAGIKGTEMTYDGAEVKELLDKRTARLTASKNKGKAEHTNAVATEKKNLGF